MDDATTEALSLQQLRVFVRVVEEGSFSAAARTMRRAQSAISYSIANLERLLDVTLFERSGRRPTLTSEGEALYREARAVVLQVGRFRAKAGRLASGIEASVDLAVDHRLPSAVLMEAIDDIQGRFPAVAVTVRTELSGAVADLVAEGTSALGIAGALPPSAPGGLEQQPLLTVGSDVVVSPEHPLARTARPASFEDLANHTQLVLIGRDDVPDEPPGDAPGGPVTQLTDPATFSAFLRAGLGWGTLPTHLASPEIDAGRLTAIRPSGWPHGYSTPLFVVHRRVDPPGMAARALVERLAQLVGDEDYASIDLSTRA